MLHQKSHSKDGAAPPTLLFRLVISAGQQPSPRGAGILDHPDFSLSRTSQPQSVPSSYCLDHREPLPASQILSASQSTAVTAARVAFPELSNFPHSWFSFSPSPLHVLTPLAVPQAHPLIPTSGLYSHHQEDPFPLDTGMAPVPLKPCPCCLLLAVLNSLEYFIAVHLHLTSPYLDRVSTPRAWCRGGGLHLLHG